MNLRQPTVGRLPEAVGRQPEEAVKPNMHATPHVDPLAATVMGEDLWDDDITFNPMEKQISKAVRRELQNMNITHRKTIGSA